MRLLVSLCSSTAEAPEALVVYDAATERVEPGWLPDSGTGAFGLCVAYGKIYTLVDHGRPNPDEPERSELYALDSGTQMFDGATRFAWGETCIRWRPAPIGSGSRARAPTRCSNFRLMTRVASLTNA